MKTTDNEFHVQSNLAYQALYNFEHLLLKEIEAETGKDRLYWLKQSLKNLRAAKAYQLRAGSAYNAANFHRQGQ